MLKKLLALATGILIFIVLLLLAADIDVGVWDITNDEGAGNGYTYIVDGNPANDSGTIDTIKFKLGANVSSKTITVIIMEKVDTNDFTARDYETITGITGNSGDTITLSAPGDFTALNIVSGDYIGMWITDCTVARHNTPSYGWWYLGSDEKECTSTTFSYSAASDLSMYGETVEAAEEENVIFFGINFLGRTFLR